ncbi:MAG: metallophosphoesterase [Oscillospiraceae bacterium]|nr:metallophosphoesterase [Oscillospiraceae bacterium]
MSRKKFLLSTAGVILTGWLLWGNSALETTEYSVSSCRMPEGFEGFRIAQISDLHNASLGNGNEKLLAALKEAKPDIIVLTGDLIDCRKLKMDVAVRFAEQAAKIAPCYYVPGNHEARIEELPKLLKGLTEAGVTVLRNEKCMLYRGGDILTLMGIDDPSFVADYMTGDNEPVIRAALQALTEETDGYRILLSHRPEWFSVYRDFDIDLTFSGHAHGGQFRFPFVGGLIAPNQGFFPEYDAGVFTDGECSMVVSRGLGASIIPLRIGNRPELVVAELHRQEA